MVKWLFLYVIFFSFISCQSSIPPPEPHLELGQKVSFVGGSPDSEYVVIGYRDQLEAKTEATWQNQPYIVIVYLNANKEIKQGVIHINAIQKR